jgi:sugar-specific transcriptional regulator TrmB
MLEIESILSEIGLTKGETATYLTLLKLGSSTTGRIIDEAQISSGRIYEILEKLSKKGLVHHIIKNNTKYFSASNPKTLLDYIKEKERKLKEKEDKLKDHLPKMIALQEQTQEEISASVYKGMKGLQTIMDKALMELDKNSEFVAMGIVEKKPNLRFNAFWKKWNQKRIKNKTKARLLFSEPIASYRIIFEKMPLTKTKQISTITPSAIASWKDTTIILDYNKESWIMIKNSNTAQSIRSFFESLWKISKS